MKKQKILFTALAALVLAPVAVPITTQSVQAVTEASQVQQAQMLALGGTLNAQEAQQTIALLGAGSVTPDNTIYVDGNMINRYLNDGSNASTQVYSSAYIAPQQEGYGVQVQIVTPQNITQVSSTTYQNAAITAGARNALIKIGTITPVTGEGALTGVYALLESQGVAINPQDVQTAQNEIVVVQNVQEDTQLSDEVVNNIIAEIKKEVIIQNEENNGNVNTTEIVNTVVNQVINNTNIVGDGNVVDNSAEIDNQIDISNETIQELENYAQDFAQTDAAQNVDTLEQIEVSFEAEGPWSGILAQQPVEATMTIEDIIATEADYFGSEDQESVFAGVEAYHPIVESLYTVFYDYVEQGLLIEELYSHTFVVESLLAEDLTAETQAAVNELRILMYQYAANFDEAQAQEAADLGVEYIPVKDQWLNQISAAENTRVSDPSLAEIIQLTANATGLAPEVYSYQEFNQEGSLIDFSVVWDSVTHQSIMGRFIFDLETQTFSEIDYLTDSPMALQSMTFDFQSLYGVAVENNYQGMPVPADYTIPGYVPEEETTEEITEEETTEETVESLPETSEEFEEYESESTEEPYSDSENGEEGYTDPEVNESSEESDY